MRAIVFDLDGTLIDSAEDILGALRNALQAAGLRDFPPLTRSLVGPPVKEILRKLPLDLSDALADRVVGYFRTGYDKGPMDKTVLYPGVRETLHVLGERGVFMVVATNKPHDPSSALLSHLLPGFIADFLCIDSIAGRKLSKTEMVAELIRRHGLDPRGTWVVGDGASDIRAAIELSCLPIAVLYGYGDPDELSAAGARVFLKTLPDILDIEGLSA